MLAGLEEWFRGTAGAYWDMDPDQPQFSCETWWNRVNRSAIIGHGGFHRLIGRGSVKERCIQRRSNLDETGFAAINYRRRCFGVCRLFPRGRGRDEVGASALQTLDVSSNGPFTELADGSLATLEQEAMRISKDNGKTWSDPTPVCKGIAGGPPGRQEPAAYYVVRTKNDVLVAVYLNFTTYNFTWDRTTNQPKDDCALEIWAVRSLDGGKTWVDNQRILKATIPTSLDSFKPPAAVSLPWCRTSFATRGDTRPVRLHRTTTEKRGNEVISSISAVMETTPARWNPLWRNWATADC